LSNELSCVVATLVFRALTHQPVNPQPAQYFFSFSG